MGHSGGRWLQDIFNKHQDVQMWQEANHYLKVDHLETNRQLDAVYEFFIDQLKSNTKRVLGLIKSFDERIIGLCDELGGSIFQMYSHPVSVLDAKAGKKNKDCSSAGLLVLPGTEEEIFKAHALYYASIYRTYLDRSCKWPIIKLEDLNKSINSDFIFFREFSNQIFDIEWDSILLKEIKDMYEIKGDLSRAYSEHLPSHDIFERWPKWKRSVFIEAFNDILDRSGYSI